MSSKQIIATLAAVLALSATVAVLAILHGNRTNEGDVPDAARPPDAAHRDTRPPDGRARCSQRAENKKNAKTAETHSCASKTRSSRHVDADASDDTDERTDLPPNDRRLLKAIEQARDDESLDQIVKLLPEAAASTNTEIRSELVDAIDDFGVAAMNHLLPFMADPDDDVRQSALDSWTSNLGEIEDEKTRAKLITAVMQVLDDEDALESMTMELTDMDEKIAIQTLVDVIEGGKARPKAVTAAREQYEFITGDEYTTIESADQWLTENYEPKDEKDGNAGK